jgi:hypothetical protein
MSGLEQASEASVARAKCVGTSEFPTRKDVLLLTASPDKDKPQRDEAVAVAREDRPQWRPA